MKVVLVEDDYSYRTMMSEFLEDLGYAVIQADHPNGLKDIEGCNTFILDVMIHSDRTAGIDFVIDSQAQGLMENDALVIFISNFGRETQEIRSRLAQIKKFEWLDKPVDLPSLKRKLSKQGKEDE